MSLKPFATRLDQYAELLVKLGLNVQPDQTVWINAPLQAAAAVRAITRKAYEVGARHVFVDWEDHEVNRIRLELASEDALGEAPQWKADALEQLAKEGMCYLQLQAPNPELLSHIDPARVAMANKARSATFKPFLDYTRNDEISWLIAAVPTVEWAAKVFPGLPADEGVEQLWDVIFQVNRVDEPSPLEAWREHIDFLERRMKELNDAQFAKLHYRGPGTDLTIELPEGHLWVSARNENARGISFVPNMPTEEVFTSPKRDGTTGVVRSTKPLHYGGTLIEDFSLTFEQGKVVEVKAKRGQETLQKLLDTDEGARYLGEAALVPHRSPISDSGLVFYNTLFDENASCHLAVGAAFRACLEGGKSMSAEEFARRGCNNSLVHVDFMIGSAELDIDGIKADGTVVPLFRQGNWA